MKSFLILSALTISIASTQAFAEVFKWVDDKGKVNFGDRPPLNVNAKKIEIKVASGNETKPVKGLEEKQESLEQAVPVSQTFNNGKSEPKQGQKKFPRRSAPSTSKHY